MFDAGKQAVIAALPVTLLFFAGWAFLSYYLSSFGIDITEFDFSIQTILAFSFRPLNTIYAWLAAILCVFTFYIGWRLWISRNISCSFWSAFSAILALILVFKILDGLAEYSAKMAAAQVWSGERVRVEARLAPEEEVRGDLIVTDYLKCRSPRRFVHVFSSVSKSYLLCPTISEPDTSGMLYVVENTGIVSSRRKIRRKP